MTVIEHEIKLTVLGEVPDLHRASDLAGKRLRFLRTEKQHNQYFDSGNQELSACGCGFRIREVKGQYMATFKGPASSNEFGLQSRQELEAVLPKTTIENQIIIPEITKHLGPNIVAAIEKIVPIASLRKTLEIFTERQVFTLEDLGELMLDHVRVPNHRGEIILGYWEIELELSSPDSATAQLESLLVDLNKLTQLEPSKTTKLGNALNALGLSSRKT